MGRYAARYSAKYINKQLKKLKKMQKNIQKSMKKAAQQTKRFIQQKAKQARTIKKRAADKIKKANSWAHKGLKEGAKRLGKAVEVSADWVKSQKSNVLKGADVIGDFLGVKDAYILVTGKDWHGNKRSRVEAGAWLIAGFTPMGKAAKAGKMAVKGVKSTKIVKSVGQKVKNSKTGKAIKNGYNRGKQLKSKVKQKVGKYLTKKKPAPKKKAPIIQRGWVFLQQTLPNGTVKFFKQPVEFIKRDIFRIPYKLSNPSHAKKHLIKPKLDAKKKPIINKNNGVSGAHNRHEFYKAFGQAGLKKNVAWKELSVTQNAGGVRGLTDIKYQMYKKNRDGSFTKELAGSSHTKTVYDPKIWSDETIFKLGEQAMKRGKYSTKNKNQIHGTAPNGMKFVGYLDKNKKVTNFFPVSKFP